MLTIDRPHRRNALDPPTIHALAAAIDGARGEVRAVVLTAVGTEAFGSGMDLRALAADRSAAGAAAQELRAALWGTDRVPIVAAVNGDAMGGGFEIALRCDLVVAATHARFGLPEVGHGLLPGGGGTLLPTRIPIAVALELGLTGEPVGADRAHALGLVNHVVPPELVLDRAVELADRIAAHAPLAVAWTRRAMWAALDGAEAGWRETLTGQAVVAESADMREGMRAFAEKRPPRWTGR